mgnify:CR=1 FL=1
MQIIIMGLGVGGYLLLAFSTWIHWFLFAVDLNVVCFHNRCLLGR